jgi:hypothetical protein
VKTDDAVETPVRIDQVGGHEDRLADGVRRREDRVGDERSDVDVAEYRR